MYLVIKDSEKAKEYLKTNRPLKVGDKFHGPNKTQMQALGAQYPDVFDFVVPGQEKQADKKEKGDIKPSSNKLLKKTTKTKTKSSSN